MTLETWDEIDADEEATFRYLPNEYYKFEQIIASGDPLWPKRAWRDEYNTAASEGRDPDLTGAQIRAVERAEWIKRSKAQQQLPAWRRSAIKLITELDNVEDEIATIAWFVELTGAKLAGPLMRGVKVAQELGYAADAVNAALTLPGLGRAVKSKLERDARRRRRARARRAGTLNKTLVWFQDNWGHLFEAGQASASWTGYGIQPGPIMGVMEEGWWGVARWANEGYLEIADLVEPGAKRDFLRWAAEGDAALQRRWDETWGSRRPRAGYDIVVDELAGWWEVSEERTELTRLTAKEKRALHNAEKEIQRNAAKRRPEPIEITYAVEP